MSDAGAKRAAGNRASLHFFLAVLLLFGAVTAKMVAPYVMALGMGALLALIAGPLMRRLSGARTRPGLAAFVTTMITVLIVVAPLVLFTSLAVKQGVTFAKWITEGDLSMKDVVEKVTAVLPTKLLGLDPAEIDEHLRGGLSAVARVASDTVLAAAKSLPDGILQLLLSCLACYFFLADGRAFRNWIEEKLPLDAGIRQAIAASFRDTAISVVWASMAAAVTQALVMSVAYFALGLPGTFLAGGATFIFAWIPVLGSTPVWLIGAATLYLKGAYVKVGIMVAFGLFAGVVDNFVRPVILKGRGEMHPLVSLVAIFGGLQMFGLFGVFFGPILAAIVITLLQVWPEFARRHGIRVGDALISPARSPDPAAPRTDDR